MRRTKAIGSRRGLDVPSTVEGAVLGGRGPVHVLRGNIVPGGWFVTDDVNGDRIAVPLPTRREIGS